MVFGAFDISASTFFLDAVDSWVMILEGDGEDVVACSGVPVLRGREAFVLDSDLDEERERDILLRNTLVFIRGEETSVDGFRFRLSGLGFRRSS